jgi:hypothetical protein
VETVASSKKATLAEVLPELARDRLKEVCRAPGLDDSGREKRVLVDRLTGSGGTGKVAPRPGRTVPRAAPVELTTGERRAAGYGTQEPNCCPLTMMGPAQ